MNLLPKPLRQALRVLPLLPQSSSHHAARRPAFYPTPVLQAPPLADELAQSPDPAHDMAQRPDERDAVRGCGWFESSFELHQGLAVSESTEAGWAEWDAWIAVTQDPVVLEPSSAQLQ